MEKSLLLCNQSNIQALITWHVCKDESLIKQGASEFWFLHLMDGGAEERREECSCWLQKGEVSERRRGETLQDGHRTSPGSTDRRENIRLEQWDTDRARWSLGYYPFFMAEATQLAILSRVIT